MKKVTLDQEKCIGCETCLYTCPAGIGRDANDKPKIIDPNAPCLEDAAELCPAKCIKIEDV